MMLVILKSFPVSSLLAKKRESDGHTHEWKVHVKPYASNEDMSSYVKKVQFKVSQQTPVTKKVFKMRNIPG